MISATSPDKPGALCLFIFFNAVAISSILMQSAGRTPADIQEQKEEEHYGAFIDLLSLSGVPKKGLGG